MKKILLVTLQGANIGNRLQNYALQTVLEKMGVEVSTPIYQLTNTTIFKIKLLIKKMLLFCGIKKYKIALLQKKREKEYEKFSEKYIHNKINVTFNNVYSMNWEEYDYAITGSDQVWHNWSNTEEELRYFYLMFMPKEKRMSYAPSFGFSEFPEKDYNIHKQGLEEIQLLSCREADGKKLILDLTGREAELIIDPTLLLTAEDWIKIEKKPVYPVEEQYMLIYFLGNETPEYENAYRKIAEEHNLKIIDIYNQDIEEYYYTKPDEFLWLIHHAKFVCTDSFHACVFSLIFHKKFMVFKRCQTGMEKMFGRIETLLSMVGLTELIYNGKPVEYSMKIDYMKVEELIKEKSEIAMKYLRKIVKVEE